MEIRIKETKYDGTLFAIDGIEEGFWLTKEDLLELKEKIEIALTLKENK